MQRCAYLCTELLEACAVESVPNEFWNRLRHAGLDHLSQCAVACHGITIKERWVAIDGRLHLVETDAGRDGALPHEHEQVAKAPTTSHQHMGHWSDSLAQCESASKRIECGIRTNVDERCGFCAEWDSQAHEERRHMAAHGWCIER